MKMTAIPIINGVHEAIPEELYKKTGRIMTQQMK